MWWIREGLGNGGGIREGLGHGGGTGRAWVMVVDQGGPG